MMHTIDYNGFPVSFHADYFYTHPIQNIKDFVKKYNAILAKGYVFDPLSDGDGMIDANI